MVLARELTKLHEEIFRGTLADAVARYRGAGASSSGSTAPSNDGSGKGDDGARDPRGEFTVVLGPHAALGEGVGGVEGAARAREALEARWGWCCCCDVGLLFSEGEGCFGGSGIWR